MNLKDRFESFDDEYLKFDMVENKRNERPDLHAWLLLDELFPRPGSDMVCSAGHDEIWLDPEGDQLKKLTNDQIQDLVRCGVRYDQENECLAMFV